MEVDARNTARDFAKNVICPQVGCPPTSGQYWPNYDNLGINLPVSLKAAVPNYEELTRQLYRAILGRDPDPSGFRDNVNAMRQNGFEWVRAGIAGSQESRNNINNMYRQYLCRNADPGGMDHWINLLASGQMLLDQVRNGIANSTEAQQHKNGCR